MSKSKDQSSESGGEVNNSSDSSQNQNVDNVDGSGEEGMRAIVTDQLTKIGAGGPWVW